MKHFIAIIALLVFSTTALSASHRPGILLLPPTMINAQGGDRGVAWVGDSLQQSLQSDLHHASIAHAAGPASDDAAAMARLAHNASVDFLVQPHVQIVADQVRLIAEVFNDSGSSIGTVKATGDLRKLFDLQDALADQIQNLLDRTTVAKHPVTTPIPVMAGSGPLTVSLPTIVPVGTVPVSYNSEAMRDGRDRYIYQVPLYGCFGSCGYGFGGFGFGGFGGGFGCGHIGVFDGGYSTGGQHSLAW